MRGPMSGQISAHTSRAGRPSAHGYFLSSVSRRYASLQKNVSSGPHAIHILKRDVSSTWTMLASARGHCSGGPIGVAAQSTASRSCPTGPPAVRAARALPLSAIGLRVYAFLRVGDDVQHLDEPGELEDALDARRPADGDCELLVGSCARLCWPTITPNPLESMNVTSRRSSTTVAAPAAGFRSASRSCGDVGEIDLAGRDDDDAVPARLVTNFEQGIR